MILKTIIHYFNYLENFNYHNCEKNHKSIPDTAIIDYNWQSFLLMFKRE